MTNTLFWSPSSFKISKQTITELQRSWDLILDLQLTLDVKLPCRKLAWLIVAINPSLQRKYFSYTAMKNKWYPLEEVRTWIIFSCQSLTGIKEQQALSLPVLKHHPLDVFPQCALFFFLIVWSRAVWQNEHERSSDWCELAGQGPSYSS